jgi:formylglycine-generating enzyme
MTCGANGDRDCCAAGLVTGGSFNRSNDANYPATVSDFRLDNYEITVGRFRKFVAAYRQDIIPANAGRNPNNPSDTGWDATWNEYLPADQAALVATLKCSGGVDVWQDSVGSALSESLPLPCLSWFAAEAFCIWDGGRLPTEAEWNFAAAGGNQQRIFPWGSAELDCSRANYTGGSPCADGVTRVGSKSPLGDGRYGQSDLAGNLRELTQDGYADPYSFATCKDCADLAPSSARVVRGGAFIEELALSSSTRASAGAYYGSQYLGARCARMP